MRHSLRSDRNGAVTRPESGTQVRYLNVEDRDGLQAGVGIQDQSLNPRLTTHSENPTS